MSCGSSAQSELFTEGTACSVPSVSLHDYDVVIVNSSAGKDSVAALFEICRMADDQGYDKGGIHVSHQHLGEMEWKGTKELAKQQADHFGLQIHYTKRRDKTGYEETLLEYVERRGMWPSSQQRYCTSDFKRGPGGRLITRLAPGRRKSKVLYVFGFRAQESPARSKREPLALNTNYTTKSGRQVWDYLPIHHWSTDRVWSTIRENGLPYHWAYDLGMPRLSCCFCIFSPFDALVTAGYANPELLDRYVEVEKKIGHTFRDGFSIEEVKRAIEQEYKPESISDWVM